MITFYLTLILIQLSHGFDPDVDICDEPLLDAAIFADDGNTYVFKGDYYWQTRTLDEDVGIIGYAKPIRNKWSQVTDAISSIFTVTDRYGSLMTIFLVRDKWFAYQKGVLKLTNTTNTWPSFPYLIKEIAAFSINNEIDKVYLLYDGITKYNLYDLKNLNKPGLIKSDRTTISSNYIWFIEENPFEGESIITDLMKVNAVISYENFLIFISKNVYCKVNLRMRRFEKECKPNSTTFKLLGCPLDIDKRPVTVPLKTVKTTTATLTQTKQTLVARNITDGTASDDDYSLFGNSSEAAVEHRAKIKKRKSSAMLVLIITGILILLVVVGIIIIAVLVNRGKKRNSSKLYIKNNRTKHKEESLGKDGELLVENSRTGSFHQTSAQSYKLNSISTKSSSTSPIKR